MVWVSGGVEGLASHRMGFLLSELATAALLWPNLDISAQRTMLVPYIEALANRSIWFC